MSKLTEAQQAYLSVAAERPMAFRDVSKGASRRCVDALIARKLLCRDSLSGVYRITRAGRSALSRTSQK